MSAAKKSPKAKPPTPSEIAKTISAARDRERALRARRANCELLAPEDADFLAEADAEIANVADEAARQRKQRDAEPDVAEAEALLARILAAFGHDGRRAIEKAKPGDRRTMTFALAGAPDDPRAYAKAHRDELRALRVFFGRTVTAIDRLRAVLHRPDDYRREWTRIVTAWNERIVGDAVTIPTLCEICGAPVFVRRAVGGEPSMACSEQHADTILKRRVRSPK